MILLFILANLTFLRKKIIFYRRLTSGDNNKELLGHQQGNQNIAQLDHLHNFYDGGSTKHFEFRRDLIR